MTSQFPTSIVSTLSDFVTLLEEKISDRYRITLFRGQPTDKALIPKIARFIFKKSREVDERRMFEEFTSSSIQYLRHPPKSELECLTIAQHHGLPTRLLDWTENALAALYFAVNKPPNDNDRAVVWVISLDRDSEYLLKSTDIGIFDQDQIRFFKPASIIPRVTSQFGWFSLHPYRGHGFYVRADKPFEDSTRINQIIIEDGCTSEIRKTLESCGINRHSIFMDLDSLGTYIFNKYRKD